MAKNSRYWAKRFEDLKRAEMQTSETYIKDLNEAFDKASAAVEKDLAQWFQRLADNNGVSLAKARQMLDAKSLKEFHWDVKEYEKRMMEDGANHIWMKELENASAKTHISWLEAEKLRLQQSAEELYAKHAADTKSFLGKTYQDGYLHSAYEVQHGIGAGSPFRIPDTRTIDKVLSKPWAPDGKNFSDRIWREKDKLVGELHTNLTQMVTRGEAPDRAIKAMADRFKVSRSKAGRLVSTEAAFFASASRGDCFSELGVDRYQIVATLDIDTCAECGDLDGTVYKESEREPGVTAPPFHPNCHCSDAPYFDDEFTKNERRAARDKDGNYYTVPASMKYPEWKAYNEAVGREPEITETLKSIVSGNNAHLEGLEFRTKTPESFMQKVQGDMTEKHITASAAIQRVYDTVRYTSVLKPDSFLVSYTGVVDGLNKKGYTVLRVKNTLGNPDAIYRGVNAVIADPTGFKFELQFHTKESFDAKQKMHGLYEQARASGTSKAEQRRLEAEMQRISESIVLPKGIQHIRSFSKVERG